MAGREITLIGNTMDKAIQQSIVKDRENNVIAIVSTVLLEQDSTYETVVFWPSNSRIVGWASTIDEIESIHLDTIHKLYIGEIIE